MNTQQEQIAIQVMKDRPVLTMAHLIMMVAVAAGVNYAQAEALVKAQDSAISWIIK